MNVNELSDLTELAYQVELVRTAAQVAVKGQEANLIAQQVSDPKLIEDTVEISEYAKNMILAEADWI